MPIYGSCKTCGGETRNYVCPNCERNDAKAKFQKLATMLKEASDERYQFLQECYAEADKYKREGDMYGWNFHQGRAAGGNETDILYGKFRRLLGTFLEEL